MSPPSCSSIPLRTRADDDERDRYFINDHILQMKAWQKEQEEREQGKPAKEGSAKLEGEGAVAVKGVKA